MTNENKIITATLSLTKDQWEYMASHVMNDLSMLEVGLGPQIGKDRMTEIVLNGLKIVNQIKEASGIDIDLSEWELRYKENHAN